MKNVIFISPNFPTNYWQFCRELKNNGMNVLGIGDQPYDQLMQELKDSLTEYYKVDSLENRDEVYRAIAFFIHKYGRIDWLESNNEYWLEKDASFRTDYNITSGFWNDDMPRIKYKSKMKEFYTKAGVPVARYHLVDDLEGCMNFIKEVGYPVITKPDNGVGASHTIKITNDDEMKDFIENKDPSILYIMEDFIYGEICSYDAIVDSKGEPLFEAGNIFPIAIMDVVNDGGELMYWVLKDLPEDTRAAGRAVVKSFNVKSRFIHFEFFRLLEDQEGFGKKGDLVALEVNMRPAGGFTPDMINFAHSTNVFKIWADMIAFDHSTKPAENHQFCAYAGLRDGRNYVMSQDMIQEKYRDHMKMSGRIPDVLSGAMGNQFYIATFDTEEEMQDFYKNLFEKR